MDSVKEFFYNFFYGIFLFFKYLYKSIAFVISTILQGLGYIWYPLKERIKDCCICCKKRYNPY